jgi:NAD(P)-dependent dehydrogenase (short-subunit alcohol dehydrogenase family)
MSETPSPKGSVVITGAGGGIGLATARLLLDEGYRVLACDLTRGPLAQIDSPALHFDALDVRNAAALRASVAGEEARGHAIAGLVTCAGILKRMPYLEMDEDSFDRHLDINLKGTLFACQAVLPAMRRQGRGSIVMFSSSIARSGSATGAHYAASKGGVLGLMRSLALEVAREGIRVNAISPGVTDTAMPRSHSTDAQLYAKADTIPLARIGQPQDMAQAALFLLGEDSSYVTGQDLRVDGGDNLF